MVNRRLPFFFYSAGALFFSASLEADSERFHKNVHWEFYADFLYMTRDELQNKPLVTDDGGTVMNTKDLVHRFTFEPGYRFGVIYAPSERYALDGSISSLQPWVATKTKEEAGSLSYPFDDPDYDPGFIDADIARAHYKSEFWDAQINLIQFFTPRRGEYFALSALMGVRFFHLDEKFSLEMTQDSITNPYRTSTENRLLALQVGFDFQMHPNRLLNWELNAKGGCFANSTEQSQFLGNNTLGIPLTVRDSSAQKWQVGFFADVLAKLGFEIRSWLDLHIGYEALFFTGMALAPEQLSRKVTAHAGSHDYTAGNVVIHGVVAGITIRI